jgi:heme/copper-type cytochrome/quinol oxidase subunit 3
MAEAELLDEASEFEYELESAEGGLWTGTRLLIGVGVMAWTGVAFAYFYLRALDQSGNWDPHGAHPSQVIGTCIFGLILGGAALATYGRYKLSRGFAFEFQVAGWLSVILAIIAAGFQVWEMTRLPFFPALGGYTSVFIAFGPLNVVMILSGAFWLETITARAVRLRGETGTAMDVGRSDLPEARLLRASLEGCTSFWWFMAAASLLFWVLFYVL